MLYSKNLLGVKIHRGVGFGVGRRKFFFTKATEKKTIRESEANPRVEESFVILILGKFLFYSAKFFKSANVILKK